MNDEWEGGIRCGMQDTRMEGWDLHINDHTSSDMARQPVRRRVSTHTRLNIHIRVIEPALTVGIDHAIPFRLHSTQE